MTADPEPCYDVIIENADGSEEGIHGHQEGNAVSKKGAMTTSVRGGRSFLPIAPARWAAYTSFVWAASACKLKPRAAMTLRIVSKPGLLSPESAL